MRNFEDITFHGIFRNYQQRVLDNSTQYLKNNKIHIVAAPGSGKTILGLELIRRLNAPCLVLSPTNTIKYQWGDRFEEMFLTDTQKVEDYVSFDLLNVSLITSITYQALHSAIENVAQIDDDGYYIDYSDIDMFDIIKKYGIKTICVDEAHHLQNEWQKALDIFMNGLDKDVKVVALTATPPYDATPVEWDRYIKTCGEIDEEIFVTELVKQKNLCPHQDYIYLNYPLLEESLVIKQFKENVAKFFETVKTEKLLNSVENKIIYTYNHNSERIYKNISKYTNVFHLLKKLQALSQEGFVKSILKIDKTDSNLNNYEAALNFILKQESLLVKSKRDKLEELLKKHGLIEKNKVVLVSNSKIEKNLILSMGKIESIINITKCELSNLKDNLRMLILTDYIRKKDITKIGTGESFEDISIVSIFENIRRAVPDIKLGAVSGSLIILPSNLKKSVKEILGEDAEKLITNPLKDTGYSEYEFNISNKEKIAVIGRIFEEGLINAIVGTKSLLGEGWDSPCINTLIMASFVGSFMLSNQMRGRAIRVYKRDKNKTANIWHLVTLESEDVKTNKALDCTEETSSDYKTLKRRFNCFVGPNYESNEIESGIDRISILQKNYTPESVKAINEKMESLAKDRDLLPEKWKMANDGVMYMQDIIPTSLIPKKLAVVHAIFPTSLLAILFVLSMFVLPCATTVLVSKILWYVFGCIVLIPLIYNVVKIIRLSSSKLFVKHIASAIRDGLIENKSISKNNSIVVKVCRKKKVVNLHMISNNIREQKIFLGCVNEFFSPIDDPRYLIVRTVLGIDLYKYSFNVPAMLATKKKKAINAVCKFTILDPFRLVFVPKSQKTLFMCMRYNYKKQDAIVQKQVNLNN
ncbi:MAG: DEAD/DEAH box helicase family protein [Clostridia bacterium]|nr:DEAD/DEAH box helicase family protein [Clostridia bacterium]